MEIKVNLGSFTKNTKTGSKILTVPANFWKQSYEEREKFVTKKVGKDWRTFSEIKK